MRAKMWRHETLSIQECKGSQKSSIQIPEQIVVPATNAEGVKCLADALSFFVRCCKRCAQSTY